MTAEGSVPPLEELHAHPMGVGMRWREMGDGPNAVLFVHGFPFTGAIWNEQLAHVPTGWRFLAPDLPGFGGSPPLTAALTMDILARELECFLDDRRLERAVVCGLSMGGYVALALWRLHPESVRALVLADTKAGADTPEGRHGRYERAALARSAGVRAVADAMLPQLLSAHTREAHPEVETRLRAIMDTASVEGVARALEGMAERVDATDRLATIEVPTLVLIGEHDEMIPRAEAEALAGSIAQARLAVLPGAGHVSCMEAPDAFNAELHSFLAALE